MKTKYIYALTNQMGTCLYDTLEQHHFDAIYELERSHIYKMADVGQESRGAFILWLQDNLSVKEWRETHRLSKSNDLASWLFENPLPKEEEIQRNKYAESETYWLFEPTPNSNGNQNVPFNLEGIDLDDDAEIALFFDLVIYPKKGECGCYIKGQNQREIPIETAYQISRLRRKANQIAILTNRLVGAPHPKDDLEKAADEKIRTLENEAFLLEKKAVLAFVLITGIDCCICLGQATYEVPIPKTDLILCPSCKHPICPFCANCMNDDPKTVEEAGVYLEAADEGRNLAYCGNCGDQSPGFVLEFLRLKNCPIPEDYKIKPVKLSFQTSITVSGLSDFAKIYTTVINHFKQGRRGIAEVHHHTGEIWGIPEHSGNEWLVTICYADDR